MIVIEINYGAAMIGVQPFPPSGAASFADVAEADRAVGRVILENHSAIESWLADPMVGHKILLEHYGATVTGRYVGRGSTTVTDVTGVRVVLVKSDCGPGGLGYFIQTSYPHPSTLPVQASIVTATTMMTASATFSGPVSPNPEGKA